MNSSTTAAGKAPALLHAAALAFALLTGPAASPATADGDGHHEHGGHHEHEDPHADHPPEGWLDVVGGKDGVVQGWALDADTPERSIDVHLYLDGRPGACVGTCKVFNIDAKLPRPDVNKARRLHGDHGFRFSIPARYRDGKVHAVRAYAINTGRSAANAELQGSPKSFRLGEPRRPATSFGILYGLWHCGAAPGNRRRIPVYDVSKILQSQGRWGPVPSFHWWGEPKHGYYCLSSSSGTRILENHAVMLRDAGINFVVLDITNWGYLRGSQEMILDPLARLLKVWDGIPGAPKVVPFMMLPTDGDMADFVAAQLRAHPQRLFHFQGKPLLLFTNRRTDMGALSRFNKKFTVRLAWGIEDPGSNWSFLQPCAPGFLQSQGQQRCGQKFTVVDGVPEQIAIGTAYHQTMISDKRTAVPKFGGRTFVRQFETLYEHPEIPIALITGWNEWIAQRFCLDASGGFTGKPSQCVSETFPDGTRIFVDQYNLEYNRDIEPDTRLGDRYYRLMKDCIALYRKGRSCGHLVGPPGPDAPPSHAPLQAGFSDWASPRPPAEPLPTPPLPWSADSTSSSDESGLGSGDSIHVPVKGRDGDGGASSPAQPGAPRMGGAGPALGASVASGPGKGWAARSPDPRTVKGHGPWAQGSPTTRSICPPLTAVRAGRYGAAVGRLSQLRAVPPLVEERYELMAAELLQIPDTHWLRPLIEDRPACLSRGTHLAYLINARLPRLADACLRPDWTGENLALTWEGMPLALDAFLRCGPEAFDGRCAQCP